MLYLILLVSVQIKCVICMNLIVCYTKLFVPLLHLDVEKLSFPLMQFYSSVKCVSKVYIKI
jgi:hypothetical protein